VLKVVQNNPFIGFFYAIVIGNVAKTVNIVFEKEQTMV
jgi:hypothetical protein